MMSLLSTLKHSLPMAERLRWNVVRAKATGKRSLRMSVRSATRRLRRWILAQTEGSIAI